MIPSWGNVKEKMVFEAFSLGDLADQSSPQDGF